MPYLPIQKKAKRQKKRKANK